MARAGWSARVHERTPFMRSEGYGIAIHRNGILVLKTLGVFDEILKGAVRVSHLETRLADGTLTSQVPAKLTYRISRQHMVSVLCSAAEKAGVEVVVNSEVEGADSSGKLLLKNGKHLSADLVVGADGVNSRVRDSLGLLQRRFMLPDGAMRFVFPLEAGAAPVDMLAGAPAIEYWSGSRRLIWNACAPG
ncbi:MAG: FAD-dependent monooxygenase, partial [Burkholderiaceae bacterium]